MVVSKRGGLLQKCFVLLLPCSLPLLIYLPVHLGLEEVGLYRKPGTIAKSNRLIKDAVGMQSQLYVISVRACVCVYYNHLLA